MVGEGSTREALRIITVIRGCHHDYYNNSNKIKSVIGSHIDRLFIRQKGWLVGGHRRNENKLWECQQDILFLDHNSRTTLSRENNNKKRRGIHKLTGTKCAIKYTHSHLYICFWGFLCPNNNASLDSRYLGTSDCRSHVKSVHCPNLRTQEDY